MARILPVDELVDERYEIRAVLEHAASFHAYRAFDKEVDVEVSLWQMREELFPDPQRRRAFVGAVVAMRSLRHPHLRRMFGAGDADGVLYATCQLETDDGLLPRPGSGELLDDEALLHYATSVVDALDAAHQAGQVHGRLVPRDIVHVAGLIKVGGVGLYRDVEPTASRSVWVDRERFIAPEVLGGQAATPCSDVFSLAVMIAELASGSHDHNVAVTVDKLEATKPDLAAVLRSCLAVAVDRRPKDAPAFLERVADGLGYEPTTAEEMGPGEASAPQSGGESSAGAGGPRYGGQLNDGEHGLSTIVDASRGAGVSLEAVPATVRGPLLAPENSPDLAPVSVPTPVIASSSAANAVGRATPVMSTAPARAKPVMVSHKPKSDPGRIKPMRVPVIDRTDLKPVVRASSRAQGRPAALGNYAPPRPVGEAGPGRSPNKMILLVSAVVCILLVGAVAAFLLLRGGTAGDAKAASPAATGQMPPAPPKPTPVVTTSRDTRDNQPATPCASGMVLLSDGAEGAYCIDQYEAPGKGRMPESGLSFEQAQARCRSRGAQLCTPGQWEQACRGARGASWPYGSSYRRGLCNVKSDRGIVATGTFRACRSSAGLFDMSGNVAEWVQGAVVRGGSVADKSNGRCSRVVRRAGSSAAAFADVGYRCCAGLR